jgi:DNA-directed RNA polymerase specialized sigma24 family protein
LDPQARTEGEDELEALRRRLDHLPEKWCRAYFESQVMQRTHPQIAEQLRASERSIRNWIKAVAKAVGQRNEHD